MIVTVALSVSAGTGEASPTTVVGGDPDGKVIGTVTVPRDKKQLSVTIYDAAGKQPVRTLVEAMPKTEPDEAQVVELRWDGTTDYRKVAPAGSYSWKALASNVAAVEEEPIGQGSTPAHGKGVFGTGVDAVATDEQGNVYESSDYEEFNAELRKWTADGKRVWGGGRAGGGMALAVDDKFVYVAVDGDEILDRVPPAPEKPIYFCGKTMLMRYARDRERDFYGEETPQTPWPGMDRGYIVANPSVGASVFGLAVDGEFLYASDHYAGQVRQYDKSTGELVGSFPVNAPKGIALDQTGALWVATGKDVVKLDGNGHTVETLTGFTDPYAVAVGGEGGALHVGDVGTGQVHRYTTTPSGRTHEAFFGKATPGPIQPTRLRWPDDQYRVGGGCRNPQNKDDNPDYRQGAAASLAVLKNGDMVVVDQMNSRVVTFDKDGDKIQTGADGKPLVRSAQFIVLPQVNKKADPKIMTAGALEYDLIDEAPGWRLRANWRPNGPSGPFDRSKASVRRTLKNGRTYLYVLGASTPTRSNEVTIYEYLPDGTLRLATSIGQLAFDKDGQGWKWFVGFDTKTTNGIIDDDELRLTDNPGLGIFSATAPGAWIDDDGTIWFTMNGEWERDPLVPKPPYGVAVPVTGFSGEAQNPVYLDWDSVLKAKPAIPADTSPEKFAPSNIKIDQDTGDIYRTGWTESGHAPPEPGPQYWMGGSTIERRTSNNEVTRFVPRCQDWDATKPYRCLERDGFYGLAAVAPDGDYFYAAVNGRETHSHVGQTWIRMYTNDGLVVKEFTGANNGTGVGYVSNVDSALGLNAFTHQGRTTVMAEDSFLNRALRWRMDDVGSVHRLNGGCPKVFDWTADGASIKPGWGQCGHDKARALMAEAKRLWGENARAAAVERALEAVAMGREIAATDPAFHPTLAEWLTFVVGGYLGDVGRGDEAIVVYQEGRGLYRTLVQEQPANSQYRWGLANSSMYLAHRFWAKGDRDQATANALDSVGVLRELAAGDPAYAESPGPFLVATATFLTQHGRVDEAISLGEEAVALYRRLGSAPGHRHLTGWALNQLAYTYWAKGDRPQGIAKALEAVGIARTLPQENPRYAADHGHWLLYPAVGYLKDNGQRQEAIESAREAVDVYTRLDAVDPARYGPSLALAKQILNDLETT
ncbi:FlgD immunoglobulin-like domain containing protein [Amycolatopsis regifaucium]|uniref:Uncharacterized protein n=1 Tax=Amycolatopsis regifaucium TaxID=546365 RepID=A0A154MUS2_9PSEU|nr:FlgD immunoglobulin-like domain containing protein [Amycolatopsis regifaucium]KZB88031.1 hypothetical protein AVL48_18825 [Amycolatopsis regifaucium]OKA04467.1 hypothetical protein ATP06_0231680 [Amycolatopsis regifaucium]SFH49647.1 Tetratricopeptide repeat-containing protein [Amycolatopsis regifaucium]